MSLSDKIHQGALRGNVLARECPSREVLQHVTSRWGVLVLIALLDHDHRFSELRRKVGGVSEMMKILQLCRTRNVGFAPHSPYYGPGFLATLQIVSMTDQPVEFLYGNLEAPLFDSVFPPKDGMYTLPEGPGIGMEPNPDVIRDYRVSS